MAQAPSPLRVPAPVRLLHPQADTVQKDQDREAAKRASRGSRHQEGGAEQETTCDPDECWVTLPKAMPLPCKDASSDSPPPTAKSRLLGLPSRALCTRLQIGRPSLLLQYCTGPHWPTPHLHQGQRAPACRGPAPVRRTQQAWTHNREWQGLWQTAVSITDTEGSFHSAPADCCHAGMWVQQSQTVSSVKSKFF